MDNLCHPLAGGGLAHAGADPRPRPPRAGTRGHPGAGHHTDHRCHPLVGAARGKAGLDKRTPLAMATLMIGANLPDVDVFAYAWGSDTSLGFRRGWTHGVLALSLWPFVLTGLMLAWDRLVRRRRHPGAPPARPRRPV